MWYLIVCYVSWWPLLLISPFPLVDMIEDRESLWLILFIGVLTWVTAPIFSPILLVVNLSCFIIKPLLGL